MPRRFFKRVSPSPDTIRSHQALKMFGTLLHDPNLFHLNRKSVSGAFFLGIFVGFLPILGQIPLAALGSIAMRVNMPIAIALVWISNPVTAAPIFYGAYELGRFILGSPAVEFSIDLSWAWFNTEFPRLWQPLIVGSLICGLFFGMVGYFSIQWFWRWQVVSNWEKRKKRRE